MRALDPRIKIAYNNTMHEVTIKIEDRTYHAAKEKAESRGYFSLEEYVSDWIEGEAAEIPMTPELAGAIEEGLDDSRAGRVISRDELDRQHNAMRAQWIQTHLA